MSQRRETIRTILLDSGVDPIDLDNNSLSLQSQAFAWLSLTDVYCPTTTTRTETRVWVLQRFVLAILYFATNGDGWTMCSNNPSATDNCGNEHPFEGKTRFLDTTTSECEWAGITCNDETKNVTKILFGTSTCVCVKITCGFLHSHMPPSLFCLTERNNLVGTIPSEIGWLGGSLVELGMQQGGLSGVIPSEIGHLSLLRYLDLDYNGLTGTLPLQLWSSLVRLEQLDLNHNALTGTLDGTTTTTRRLEFVQLDSNGFTGTIPSWLGDLDRLQALTLHKTRLMGTVPPRLCAIPTLRLLTADCYGPHVVCACCNYCWP